MFRRVLAVAKRGLGTHLLSKTVRSELEMPGNHHQIGITAMLFEYLNERSLVHVLRKRPNELMTEFEDRDAARGVDAFLGFSDGDSGGSTAFIRTKIPYEPSRKMQLESQ